MKPGFNEAGAFLLRKRHATQTVDDALVDASMKPEHFCSGNEMRATVQNFSEPMLQ